MDWIGAARNGQTLLVYHPPAQCFTCTEQNCPTAFHANTWYSMKRSLERHLQETHQLEGVISINQCRACNLELGSRPSKHNCNERLPQQDTPAPTRHWSCNECNSAFPTTQGLRNHQREHRRRARLNTVNTPLVRPRTRRNTRIRRRQIDDDSSSEPDSIASRTRSRASSREPTDTTPTLPTTPQRLSPIPSTPFTPAHPNPPQNTPGSPPPPNPPPNNPQNTPSSPLSSGSGTSGSPPPQTQPSRDIAAPRNQVTDDLILAHFNETLDTIQNDPITDATWLKFLITLDQIMNEIQQAAGIKIGPAPEPRHTEANQNTQAEAKRIQRLYRYNRRRAIKVITNQKHKACPIENDILEQYFTDTWAEKSHELGAYRPINRPPIDTSPFTQAEVSTRLQKFENTSPGPDRITYDNLKKIDPEATTLTRILTVCQKYRKIPGTWKRTDTILIHKKNNEFDPTNWRPITLANTLYKLYAGCWATRLTTWIKNQEALHPAQKGFMPHDGVLEHNYMLKEEIRSAREGSQELCIAWLDITNAFGSIPHYALLEACATAGLGQAFCNILDDMITNNRTSIRTETGRTPPINVEAGIKQGCPISGLIFNLAIDPLLHELQGPDPTRTNVLAYADDIAILTRSPENLCASLRTAEAFGKRIGLSFNPQKSKTLHIGRQGRRHTVLTSQFQIEGRPIPFLSNEYDSEDFLGTPVGFNPLPGNSELQKITDLGIKILTSKLAPWQRIDAFRTFLVPTTQHHMRTGRFKKQEWEELDKIFRAELKRTLYLPQEAANEYIYGPRKAGLCGINPLAEMSDYALLDTALKLLTSRDPAVATTAQSSLDNTIQSKTKTQPSDLLRGRYLSGSTENELSNRSNTQTNTWTQARKATTRQKLAWNFHQTEPTLQVGPVEINRDKRHSAIMELRTRAQQTNLTRLLSLRSQGKAIECTASTQPSTHFMANGKYTRFADWRFIHRARLNLVPLKANKRQNNNDTEKACRRCSHPHESLPHVLNHCMRNAVAYQRRHDAILDRIHHTAALKHHILSRNQEIQGMTGLRPDLVIVRGTKATIIDVTVSFENRLEALTAARQEKIRKYSPLANHLATTYAEVAIEPVVVGSLGTWHKDNESLIHKICTRRYGDVMKRLIVSDTIRWSRDVYTEHLTGQRQYDRQGSGTDATPVQPT